jgi:cation diffusion facilitator CzcD-associated flavoprotein CzcO
MECNQDAQPENQTIRSVAVIGAGPSGLAAARRLRDVNLKVTIFERKGGLGGLW